MVLIIILLVLQLLIAGGIFGFVYYKRNENKEFPFKRYLFMLASFGVWVFILAGSFSSVRANHVGIVFDQLNGGLLDETKAQGIHFTGPFKKVINIPTTNTTAWLEVNAQTNDSIYAQYELTMTYRVLPEDGGRFYKLTGSTTMPESNLNTLVKESIQSVSTKYDIFEIMGENLDKVRSETFEILKKSLDEKYHVQLIALSIDDIDAGNRIEDIIREKAEAIQKIQIAEQEKQRATIEAQTELIRAENEATILLLKAEASADAQAILNSVAVTAIQKMYVSQFEDEIVKKEFEENQKGGFLTIIEISEIVIKQLYYDVWDGKLPNVITDGNGGIIIQP